MPKLLHLAKMTGVSGMEKHLAILLPGLAKAGYEVHLLILIEPDHPMNDYAAGLQGVQVTQHVIKRDLDIGLIGWLADFIKAGKFDALHTHLIHADMHGVLAAGRAGLRTIITTGHNDDPFRRRLPIRLFQRYLWQRVTRGIAISEALRTFMIRVEGAPPGKAVTVHYGLHPVNIGEGARSVVRHELGLPEQGTVFGSVARLVEQKGLSDGLRAFWQVSREISDAHYVIVGDGPLRKKLQGEVEGYGIGHRVHFLGQRSDAQTIMAAFDALLMPSHWEGFGLVALEAMAVRVPIIATNVSALPEIIARGETGYLVPAREVEALAQAMLDIGNYPDQARALGNAGRARLEQHFSAEGMIARTVDVYHGVGL